MCLTADREVNRSPLIRPTAVCLRGSRARRGSERCSSPPRGQPWSLAPERAVAARRFRFRVAGRRPWPAGPWEPHRLPPAGATAKRSRRAPSRAPVAVVRDFRAGHQLVEAMSVTVPVETAQPTHLPPGDTEGHLEGTSPRATLIASAPGRTREDHPSVQTTSPKGGGRKGPLTTANTLRIRNG